MEVPLVDKDYLLERTPGNGGWTYAPIPEVPQDKKAPFGWVKVKGSIDGVEIKKHHLMPMGNGELGLSECVAIYIDDHSYSDSGYILFTFPLCLA